MTALRLARTRALHRASSPRQCQLPLPLQFKHQHAAYSTPSPTPPPSPPPSPPPPPPAPAHDVPPVIFSGIQPTGVPHLGNYLGALRQWVKLQNDAPPTATLLFSIVDLHAITIRQDPRQLATWRREMLASLLAVGLDPKQSIIFAQSRVKQHAELMWILSCGASMGYLGRMTQWKVCMS